MANFLEVRLTLVDEQPVDGAQLILNFRQNLSTLKGMSETRVSVRNQAGQWTCNTGSPIPVPAQTVTLADALDLDWRQGGGGTIFPVIISIEQDNVVAIKFIQYGWELLSSTMPDANLTIVTTPEVPPAPEFEITDVTDSQADSEPVCTYAKRTFSVENGVAPYTISGAASKVAPTEGDLWVDILRYTAGDQSIIITDDNGDFDTIIVPKISTFTFDTVEVIEALGGATVTLQPSYDQSEVIQKAFEYSIDNLSWKSTNQYTGIAAGGYTGYVRDQLGCVKTTPFTVVGVAEERPDPFFEISTVNAIRHVDNSLSSTYDSLWRKRVFTNLQYFDVVQIYESDESITTQIRSSYRDIVAKLRDLQGVEVKDYTVTKQISNIGLTDQRPANVKAGTEANQTFVYFDGSEISLPETWMVAGLQITISGVNAGALAGTYIVSDVVYDKSINKDVLVIDVIYPYGTEVRPITLDSNYDLEPWDVYEFNATFDSLIKGRYYIDIDATDTDPNYDPKNWRSEDICVADEWNDSILLEYQDTDNSVIGDIIPSTGIIHKLRLKSRFFAYGATREKTTFRTDTGNVVLIKQINARTIQLEGRFPDFIDEKIGFAASHKTIIVNGEQFRVSEEEQESENKTDERNPFVDTILTLQAINTVVKTTAAGIVSSSDTVLGDGNNVVIGIFE